MTNSFGGDITEMSNLFSVPLDAAEDSFGSIGDGDLYAQLTQIIGLQKTMLEMMIADKEKAEYNSFGKRMERAMDFARDKFNQLGTALGTAADKLRGHFKAFFEKMGEFGKMISEKAKVLAGKANEFKDYVKGKMGEAAEHVKTFYKETMAPALEKAAAPVKEAFNKAVETIKPHMEDASDNIAIVYLGTKERIGKAIESAGKALKSSGAHLEKDSLSRKNALQENKFRRNKGPKQI